MCPDLTLRSTFIVGFPGETEAEFEELLDFLDEAQLDRVGAFAYSPVDGAAANALPDPVPEELKQERLARFMERQGEISAARLEAKVGTVQRCLVDLLDGELAIARSMADAPERRWRWQWIGRRSLGARGRTRVERGLPRCPTPHP